MVSNEVKNTKENYSLEDYGISANMLTEIAHAIGVHKNCLENVLDVPLLGAT